MRRPIQWNQNAVEQVVGLFWKRDCRCFWGNLPPQRRFQRIAMTHQPDKQVSFGAVGEFIQQTQMANGVDHGLIDGAVPGIGGFSERYIAPRLGA